MVTRARSKRIEQHGVELSPGTETPQADSRLSRLLALRSVVGNRAFGQLLSSARAVSRGAGDSLELDAERMAQQVMSSSHSSAQRQSSPESGRPQVTPAQSQGSALTTGGEPLDPSVQTFYESRFNHDFAAVRIHTGAESERRTADLSARAFTWGNHVWMGRSSAAQPSLLLAHELAHVVQYSAGAEPRLARSPLPESPDQTPEADPDAGVSLGILDNPLVARAAAELVGPAHWTVLKEFLRGIQGGLQSVSPEQQARIDQKFSSFGVANAVRYAGGYTIGVVEGLWAGLKGLVEAIVTLLKLPYEIDRFLAEKLPQLALRYGPRIAAFLAEGDGISARLAKLAVDALKNPAATLRQFDALLDGIKRLALQQVRSLGHGLASKVLAFLEEDWFAYGRDIGKLVGQILFEVLLALASDAIGSVLKGAAELASRLVARTVEGVVEIFSKIRTLFGQALEWLQGAARRLAGQAGELLESLRALVSRLLGLFDELVPALADTGTGVSLPVPKGVPILEARAPRLPGATPRPAPGLSSPKVPSNVVAESSPATKGTTRSRSPSTESAASGETSATITGKELHGERAAERRISGEWDEVNEALKNADGEPIEVAHRVDLKTGEPVGTRTQTARPDAVSYKRGQILDDKPLGRPISKDRQEIVRFIKAYEERTGTLPKQIIIERYDPKTGARVLSEIYSPRDFLP